MIRTTILTILTAIGTSFYPTSFDSDRGIDKLRNQSYDIFPIWGQSNAVGQGDADTSVTVPLYCGGEFYNGNIYPLADPTHHYTDSTVSYVSHTGSMWPSFAVAYCAKTGRHVLIVGAAASGIGVNVGGGGWAGTVKYRDFLVAKTLAAKKYIESNGGTATIKAIVFEDGESDAIAEVNSGANYQTWFESGMSKVRADLNTRLGNPNLPLACISIDKTTNPAEDASFNIAHTAIQHFCTTQPYAFMAAGYQDFVDRGWMEDNYVHWNQAALNFDGTLAGMTTAIALP